MADDSSDRVRLRDVAIVGGGCYGSFYAGQLVRAQRAGRAEYRRILVVDRDPACRVAGDPDLAAGVQLVVEDWDAFFDRWLGRSAAQGPGEPPDTIVPSPLMPHLMYDWLLRRARGRWPGRVVERRPVPAGPGTPYDVTGPDRTRYLSFADWTCPVHCIEPAICPVIRAPRTWEMGESLQRLTATLAHARPTEGPVLFLCRHRVYGVGMFDVDSVLEGDRLVERAGTTHEAVDVLVGTVSSCHGAAGILHVGP